GHPLLWLVGLLTSFLTAIYMFRLVFLTFHGPRQSTGPGSQAVHLHDAPPPMAIALVALAAGSVVAGYVGLPRALGGSDWFEGFLAPSFGTAITETTSEPGLELTLMVVSSVTALVGIGVAVFLFLKNRAAAQALGERFAGIHRVLENKYYVDEIYDAAVVQPIRIVSEEGLWKDVDMRLIDGTVNGVAASVGVMSQGLRRLQ